MTFKSKCFQVHFDVCFICVNLMKIYSPEAKLNFQVNLYNLHKHYKLTHAKLEPLNILETPKMASKRAATMAENRKFTEVFAIIQDGQ